MFFALPELGYAKDALKPYISQETIEYHYGKHHQGYINKLNKLLEETPKEQKKSLEELIKTTKGSLFNNAAQAWNHAFYWQCLTPKHIEPPKELLSAIEKAFGNFEEFKAKFKENALNNFGSGWTWLVKKKDGSLALVNTSNADNPITKGDKPLLTIDVWEHAYYIDYRNERGKYIDIFFKIVNWNFVASGL